MRLLRITTITLALLLAATRAQAHFAATIPVIDMNDYYSETKHKIFIDGLSEAMRTVGFVAVINSKVDKQALDAAYTAAQNFYATPLSQKMLSNNLSLNGQRGYVASERAQGQTQKDHKEFYHIAREYPSAIRNKYSYPENVWPADPNFKSSIQNLIAELDKYTVVIGSALAESIGQPVEFFNDMTNEGAFLLRSIHYPANPNANNVWAAAHTDIDLFTILPRATAEGLQVLNAHGEWIDVIVPDNAIIINAGDMLQNITNGVYKSAVHRVINKDKTVERYSMVAFIHARPNDQMGPLPSYIAAVGTRKFGNLTAIELLSERLIELGIHSPALLEQFAKSGAMERLLEVNRASLTAMQALKDANLASPKVLASLNKT